MSRAPHLSYDERAEVREQMTEASAMRLLAQAEQVLEEVGHLAKLIEGTPLQHADKRYGKSRYGWLVEAAFDVERLAKEALTELSVRR